MSKEYNGWSNYETWNVALWIQNDEGAYSFAKGYKNKGYEALAKYFLKYISGSTPDGVKWDDSKLNIAELDKMLADL